MLLEQIFVLNRALDGKDIYALPEFGSLKMTELSISLQKDYLIETGILESYTKFTSEGVKITKLISDYKNAKRYLSIFGDTLGIIDDKKGVMLCCKNNNYEFVHIDITNLEDTLMEGIEQ